ncbi:Uncharacterised protein [Mycobacteroides abscessus subsp. abscessus]|nr:Uncharacterised protein [Mycobacteroides abscessus subsp. abscessus]
MFARIDCFSNRSCSSDGRLGIKINNIMRICQALIKIRAPPANIVFFSKRLQFIFVSSNKDWVRQDDVTIRQLHPSLLADGHNRSD